MSLLDNVIILLYFAFIITIALILSKRASGSTEDFFLSGRKLPWWIAGTTMVATTFAADTPLAVTELVAQNGIAGNWLWWNAVAGNILTVFFFAKLWRRANILTDVEFIEIRYEGKPAAFLRGFRALYLGVFMNVIIMGWVNVALSKILEHIFGIDQKWILLIIIIAMLFVGLYSAISGLWGIAFTDIFQFIVAMVGCIILAYVVLDLPQIGGLAGLKTKLPAQVFSFFPEVTLSGKTVAGSIMALSFSAFIAHMFIQWWSSWYPGAEPGGGGYVAQRMMSAKDERHSMLATLWFTIAHYALRPWPWIIVALASLVLFPELSKDEKKVGYILAMKNYLPSGLLGLLVAAFLAAYMSTISTHLNWGSSYIINDFYKRFIKPDGDKKHYVMASRVVTLILVVIASLLINVIDNISGAWKFIMECGAGLGLVLILRWYWWRINAWSEITAMIAPFIAFPFSKYVLKIQFPESLFVIVSFTTVVWIITTFITSPTSNEKLKSFYERTTPGGPGWNPIKKISNVQSTDEPLSSLFINWLLGISLVYLALFSTGYILFKEKSTGFILLALTIVVFVILWYRLLKKKEEPSKG